jgi:Na+/phosphate symporter
LSDELPALEAAFNKAHKQSQRKIMELVEFEDKIARLQAEVRLYLIRSNL